MATELAQAYVQIIPSAKGIQGSISNAIGGEASSAGVSAGSSIASKIKAAIVAAGIGTVLKNAIMEGGALEQSFGGLETIYGDAAQAAKDYSAEAAKAGISMNTYAEQAVSFGAALRQAYGGDMAAAAEAANTAILDMADNSAKMGTNIESIQNAYQGFAKQNYTMLDNLKLGYGQGKSEMERLLADAEKLSGVHYDISNLGDVYEAIHVIQEDLGLTGVAADEAANTITGSFAAMTASLKNVAGALVTGMDVTPFLKDLCESAGNFLFNNLIPAVANIIKALPSVIGGLIAEGIPTFMSSGASIIESITGGMSQGQISMITQGSVMIKSFLEGILTELPNVGNTSVKVVNDVCNGITENLPALLDEGVEIITHLANGILQALPSLIQSAGFIVTKIGMTIIENLPVILDAGLQLVQNLINGIIQNFPQIMTAAGQAIANFVGGIAMHLPEVLQKGIEIIGQIASGLVSAIPQLIGKIPQIISGIVGAFANYNWLQIGWNIISGIGQGIINGVGNLVGAAISACGELVNGVLGFFGIHSPSTLMRDKVGKFIPAGIAVGIQDNLQPVKDAMAEMDDLVSIDAENKIATQTLNSSSNLSGDALKGSKMGSNYTQNVTINSPQALNPSEVARLTRNQARQTVLAMNGI